jgi:hypothetical protein
MSNICRPVTLMLIVSTICLVARAEERKVANRLPLSGFSSHHDGRYTFNDIVRICLFRDNPSMTNIVSLSDEDLKDPNLQKLLGPQIHLAKAAALAVTAGQPGPSYSESILSDQFINYVPPPPPLLRHLERAIKTHVRLRQSWDQLSLPDAGTNVNPALFSYTRDVAKDANQWSAVGAFGYDFVCSSNVYSKWDFLPNASFDRVSSSQTNDDSLVFRAPLVYTHFSRDGWVQAQSVRLTPLYATDFEFRSSQVGGEVEWEPQVLNDLWLGNGHPLPHPGIGHEFVLLFPRAFIHFEGGSVLNAGENKNLADGRSFFRGGPNIQLQVKAGRDLPSLKNISLAAGWQEYEALRSRTVATRLFFAQASYKLTGNLDFEVQYREGRIALTGQFVQTVTVGLGLKL